VSWLHPRDRRPVFVYPWEGVALLGTTDVDHPADTALRMSPAEAGYLMEALAHQFPQQSLSLSDAIASTAGVRPIVAGGKADPSAESRESAIWSSPGWVGITGGKLTTFRITALQVLQAAARQISIPPAPGTGPEPAADRWAARYGEGFRDWETAVASPAEREPIPATPYRWSELRWAARAEQVVHLDDLLMRRLRLSLLLPSGGAALLDRIGTICREELVWDEPRWQQERARYLRVWSALHAVVP
jgi:glycerol-3-phosphate dehydrogenase